MEEMNIQSNGMPCTWDAKTATWSGRMKLPGSYCQITFILKSSFLQSWLLFRFFLFWWSFVIDYGVKFALQYWKKAHVRVKTVLLKCLWPAFCMLCKRGLWYCATNCFNVWSKLRCKWARVVPRNLFKKRKRNESIHVQSTFTVKRSKPRETPTPPNRCPKVLMLPAAQLPVVHSHSVLFFNRNFNPALRTQPPICCLPHPCLCSLTLSQIHSLQIGHNTSEMERQKAKSNSSQGKIKGDSKWNWEVGLVNSYRGAFRWSQESTSRKQSELTWWRHRLSPES